MKDATLELLLVSSRYDKSIWVLPKGHIEPGEVVGRDRGTRGLRRGGRHGARRRVPVHVTASRARRLATDRVLPARAACRRKEQRRPEDRVARWRRCDSAPDLRRASSGGEPKPAHGSSRVEGSCDFARATLAPRSDCPQCAGAGFRCPAVCSTQSANRSARS